MEIRPITPEDTEKFVNFYKKLASESEYLPFTVKEVEEKTKDEEEFIKKYGKHKQVFVAAKDGKIIGYLGLKRSHLQRLTHKAKFTIGVLKEYQRQGVASELIEYAENWAKENGIHRMELTVLEDNEPAVELFEKFDYEKEGTNEDAVMLDDDFEDEIFMAKMLED